MRIIYGSEILIVLTVILRLISISPDVFAENTPNCLDCHEGYDKSLAGTAHQISSDRLLKAAIKVECISCHDGWQEHQEMPTIENITQPFRLVSSRQVELCGRCHLTPHQKTMASTDPHANAGLSCGSCHSIHASGAETGTFDKNERCLSCHRTVALELTRRSAHPLNTGNMECTDCHEQGSAQGSLQKIGFDWTCQGCHPDKAGPFIYEHPVNYSHLTAGGSCIECHNPHGSDNDRLLNQPGSGNCLQCHSIPAGHRTVHSGLGTKFACAECHSEIHGSMNNRYLLDPQLGSKLFPDCYQSGCHIVNQ